MFIDRLPATLVHLRHATTHDVLARWFGVDTSTITRSIAEVRPLLAERGCTVGQGVRLRTLAEVIDHLGADGKSGIIDGTKVRVLAPGRRAPRTGTGSSPARTAERGQDRTRHRPPEELADPDPPPLPPRAHERHRPSHRAGLLSHQQTADLTETWQM
ncbi:transposase family protein [Streptomyces sp. NPDC058726]|uniref:helix-turn-helix domain-containing protein n=1 Tax=unclassified Streptomyces TaxID=2593676 RepID=UPI003665ADF2